jgi:hypothetical protein
LLRTPIAAPPAPATLRGAIGRVPALREVSDALFAAVIEREDEAATTLVVGPELQRAIDAAAARYRDPTWTWRR